MKKLISVICAVLVAAVMIVPVSAENTRGAVGMNVANFAGLDLITGEQVNGAMLENAVCNVINEWATWCGPCVNEMPHFKAMHEYYSATPEADVQIFGSVYYSGTCNATTARDFLASNGYSWPNIGEDNVLAAVFNNSNAIPNTIIVDRHGVVRDMYTGSFASQAMLQNYIDGWYETLLEEEGPIQQPLLGDVDSSGSVNANDALMIMRYAMDLIDLTDAQLAVADYDGSGEVNALDALSLMRAAMGLD